MNDSGQCTFATLTLDDQKTGVRGQLLGHGPSGDGTVCPIAASLRRVHHLRSNNASPATPLHTYYVNGTPRAITSADLTAALRAGATSIHQVTGIEPRRLTARSLRAGGATALMCAGVDTDIIRLMGRWNSDAMFRYLHVHAMTTQGAHAHNMFANGNFQFVPAGAQPLLPLGPLADPYPPAPLA